jgi:hypothetical protein
MEHQDIEVRDAPEPFGRIKDAVVSLTWRPNWNANIEEISSGFVLDVSGSWFLVTADHVVRDLLQKAEPGFVCISKNGDPLSHPIPFNLTDDNTVKLRQLASDTLDTERPEDANDLHWLQHLANLDIEAIWLDNLYIESLSRAGVQPFSRDDILDVESLPTDGDFELYVAGFPAVSVETTETRYSQVLKILPITLKSLDGRDRFVFEPGFGLASFKGMSGGPVMLIVFDRLWLVGVQSAQVGVEGKPPSQLLVAPAFNFLRILELVDPCRNGLAH